MNRKVRWNPDLGEFELQCADCRDRGDASFWPITLEYWRPQRTTRCRGCWLVYDRTKRRAARQDPEVRAREAAAVAAWRKRNPGYNVETAQLWREQNRERKRASDRAAYRRRVTMNRTDLGPSLMRATGRGLETSPGPAA
jgi:hypothetical protein